MEFKIELRNKFSVLSLLPEETIEEQWHSLRETWKATCTTALSRQTRKHKEWVTSDTWTLITERKTLKDRIKQTQDQEEKHELQVQYWEKNRQVKKSARKDKRSHIEELTSEAETAAGQRNMKRLYEIIRALSGKTTTPAAPSRTRTETPFQTRENREQGEQNTSRKHANDQPLPPHQTSHHQPSSWISTSTLPARPRSSKLSSPSSQARQQARTGYHLKP